MQWGERGLLAEGIWTQLQIHRALGEEAKNIFPPLALLAPLTVQIPVLKIIAARDEARRRHMDVSELVGDHICVYGDEAEWLERRFPGYYEAWHFPYLD